MDIIIIYISLTNYLNNLQFILNIILFIIIDMLYLMINILRIFEKKKNKKYLKIIKKTIKIKI